MVEQIVYEIVYFTPGEKIGSDIDHIVCVGGYYGGTDQSDQYMLDLSVMYKPDEEQDHDGSDGGGEDNKGQKIEGNQQVKPVRNVFDQCEGYDERDADKDEGPRAEYDGLQKSIQENDRLIDWLRKEEIDLFRIVIGNIAHNDTAEGEHDKQ